MTPSLERIELGARLKGEREQRAWSQAEMARKLAGALSGRQVPALDTLRNYVNRWESGGSGISLRYRRAYAEAFDTTVGELFRAIRKEPELPSLWRPEELDGEVTPDDEARLVAAIARPQRVDGAVTDSLATILAMQRRLDDTLGPAAILPATLAQTKIVTDLLRESRGAARDGLAPVVAEYVQFAGWLHAELRNDRDAVHTLTDAEELADVAESGELAAQAANFKGYLARQQGNPRGVVRHFLSAYNTPGAAPAQRLGDAVQAAQGLGLLGEKAAARRLLTEAEGLEDAAARSLPPDTAYWLTPDFQHINVGIALAALGEHAAAAEHIAAGLDSLPPDQRGAAWTREYRNALDRALELSAG